MSESNHEAKYTLSLRDLLTGKLNHAKEAAERLGGAMSHAKGLASELAGAVGIGFGIFAGVEFVKGGVEAMEKIHQAEAQLKNTMENMGTFSEEHFEKSIQSAKDLASGIKYSRSEVISLQSQLGLVGNIGEEEMNRLTKVSADLSTKLGMGLSEAGNLLAKAVNNPEMARRLGMALKIDPAVTKHIQELAKSGHEAEARMELLAVAESKVGGAAKAAFDADPMARFNKMIGSAKIEIGGLAISILKKIMPALESMARGIQNVIHWIKEHQTLVEAILVIIGILAGAFIAYEVAITAVGVATKILTVFQWLLNFAMSANPITLLVIGFAALVVALVACYKHFGTFHAVLWATWAVIKEFASIVGDVFMGLYHIIHGAFKLDPKEIAKGFEQERSAIFDSAKRIGDAAAKGYKEGMADFNKSQLEDNKAKTISSPTSVLKKIGGGVTDTDIPKPTKTTTGNKSTVINIKIDSLVKQFTVATKNISEGHEKVKELIVQTLLGAVNDSQRVAGD